MQTVIIILLIECGIALAIAIIGMIKTFFE